MTPDEILARINFLSPVAWDGFRVELNKGRKLLLKGTQDLIYDRGVLFVLFTKVQRGLPFTDDDLKEYTRQSIKLELLQADPDLRVRLTYSRDRCMEFSCARIYYSAMRLEPAELCEVIDRCYALYDDYDYAHCFGVEGELSPAEIHRRILADTDYQRRLGQ